MFSSSDLNTLKNSLRIFILDSFLTKQAHKNQYIFEDLKIKNYFDKLVPVHHAPMK